MLLIRPELVEIAHGDYYYEKNTSIFLSLSINHGVPLLGLFFISSATITCGLGLNCSALRNYVRGCRIIEVINALLKTSLFV